MLFKTIASAFLLCIYAVAGQLVNMSILDILNITQLSPSYKFIQLISSSPSYQPIVDVLSRPGNFTFFVPSDEVFDQIIQQFTSNQTDGNSNNHNDTLNPGNGNNTQSPPPPTEQPPPTNNGTQSGGTTQGFINKIKNFFPSFDSNPSNTTIPPSSSSDNNNNTNNNSTTNEFTLPLANATCNGTTILDYIFYHILPGKVNITNQTENTFVYHTLLTNITLDKFGYGIPIIINNNITQSNSSSSNNTTTDNNGNQTMVSSSSWVSKFFDSDTSNTPAYWIGNGLSFANVTIHNIEASNGFLNVINNILIPPGNLTSVYNNVTNGTQLDNIISQNATIGEVINTYTNVTIFVSNNTSNLSNLTFDQLQSIYANQSVSGIYFTTNFTDQASTNGDNSTNSSSSISLTTFAGGNIDVSVNNNTITLNNNLTIVKPNVLFSGGVIHLVNGDFEPPSTNNPGIQPPPPPSLTSSINQQPTSSINNQLPSASTTTSPQEPLNNEGNPQVGGNSNGGVGQTPDSNDPFEIISGTDNLDNNNNSQRKHHNPLENEPLPYTGY